MQSRHAVDLGGVHFCTLFKQPDDSGLIFCFDGIGQPVMVNPAA